MPIAPLLTDPASYVLSHEVFVVHSLQNTSTTKKTEIDTPKNIFTFMFILMLILVYKNTLILILI